MEMGSPTYSCSNRHSLWLRRVLDATLRCRGSGSPFRNKKLPREEVELVCNVQWQKVCWKQQVQWRALRCGAPPR